MIGVSGFGILCFCLIIYFKGLDLRCYVLVFVAMVPCYLILCFLFCLGEMLACSLQFLLNTFRCWLLASRELGVLINLGFIVGYIGSIFTFSAFRFASCTELRGL